MEDTGIVEETTTAVEAPNTATETPAPDNLNPAPWYEGIANATDKDREYHTLDEYVKGTNSLRSLISKKGIIPPGVDASAEEKAAFLEQTKQYLPENALHGEVPEPSKYEVELLTKNESIDDDRRMGIYDKFNKANLSNAQAEAVMELFAEQSEIDAKMLQTFNADSIKATSDALQAEWGSDYEDRTAAIDDILKRHPQVSDKLAAVGLSGDIEIIRMLDAVARATGEDTVQNTEASRQSASDEYSAFVNSAEYKAAIKWDSGMSAGNPKYDNLMAKARELLARTMK